MTLRPNPLTVAIRGSKGGQGSQHTPTEAPDTLHDVARIRIVDLLAEGELAGFVHGATNPLRDVYLNETPVCNDDDSFNFADVKIDSRSGTQGQDAMPGYGGAENEIGVNVELRSDAAWSQALSNLDLSAVRIRVGVDALQKSDASTGDINGYTIEYTIDVSTDGGAYVSAGSFKFSGKASDAYERTHRVDLPPATTGWTVRVTRTTANANSATIADTTRILSYTEIIDAVMRYPNSAHVGITVDAKQFQSVPSRCYNMLGRTMSVPSNYDPKTRVYTGTWDGTFKPAWTNNPAWVFYDLVTNTRFGLGKYITPARVNKWALYTIAQYCDGLVPDGKGGQEPRFTCTLYLQTQAEGYKVLADLVSVFRGITYWSGSQVQAIADMPGDADFEYNASNVIDGKFEYAGTGRKTRYTVALVSWNDPADFGRAKVAYVPDRDGIARYGIQPTQLIAVGATTKTQAKRAGLWALLTSRLDDETVTWGVGQDGVLVAPGRICRIADPKRAGKRQGGRISAAAVRVVGTDTFTDVTVDKIAEQVAAGDSLNVMLPTGVSESKVISSIAGNVVTVTGAYSTTPVAEAVWTVDAVALKTQTARVLTVREQFDNGKVQYVLTGVKHNASKFDAVDFGAPIEDPPTVAYPGNVQAAPTVVSLSSYPVQYASTAGTTLSIGWDKPANAVHYWVQYRRSNGQWSPRRLASTRHMDIPNVMPGTYEASVVAVSPLGIESTAMVSDPLVVNDPNKVPGIVDDIKAEADAAKADATAALNEIANFSQDGVLTPLEKKELIRRYNVLLTEQPGIDAQATAYSITTEKTAYDSAISALTAYLGTIPTWNDVTVDTPIVRATFDAKWNAPYTTRQTLLNTIYAAAKAKADAAQATANTAQSLASQVAVINPGFDAGDTGWNKGSGWSIKSDGSFGHGQGYAEKSGGASDSALRNNAVCFVQPGKSYKVQALIKAIGANGQCYARISWRDLNDSEIGTTNGNLISGTTVAGSFAVGQAPAGAVFAHAEIAATDHTAGRYQVDNVISTLQPATADEIAETGSKKWAAESGAEKTTGKSITVLTDRTADNISESGSRKWAGQSGADKTIDNIAGQGANLLPYMYTTFQTGQQLPPLSGSLTGEYISSNFGLTTGGSWLAIPANGSAGSETCRFAPNTSTFPLYLPPGYKYIVSARTTTTSGTPQRADFGIMYSDGTYAFTPEVATNRNSSDTQPVSAVLDLTSGKALPCHFIIRSNKNASNDGTVTYFDALMVERMVGNDPTPSTWVPGYSLLGRAGSGERLGDARNQAVVTVANYGSAWQNLSITYSATPTSATINVSAADLQMGSQSIHYNSSSVTRAGTAGQVITLYLYYQDPDYSGGSKTLNASAYYVNTINDDGRVYIGTIKITYPTSGTGGGSVSGPCPDENAWVLRADPGGLSPDWPVRAKTVRKGHFLRLTDGRAGLVTYSQRKPADRVRVRSVDGYTLTCSTSAPLELAGHPGECVLAPDAQWKLVLARFKGASCWAALIEDVEDAGDGYVQHITCQNACFWTGDDSDYLFGHHNMKPPDAG